MSNALTGGKRGSGKMQPIQTDVQPSLKEGEKGMQGVCIWAGGPVVGSKPFFGESPIIQPESLPGSTTVDVEVLFGLQPRQTVGGERRGRLKGLLLKVFPFSLGGVMELGFGPKVDPEPFTDFDFLFMHRG